jgi:hypothetical protein
MDLRELLSVFQRYDIDDFTQLKQFLTEENSEWFFKKENRIGIKKFSVRRK